MTVRYIGNVPKTLRTYADKHAHQIAEISAGDGYTTESGFAYDVLLRAGWQDSSNPTCHTIIEPTVREVLSALRYVTTCDCDDECRQASKGEKTK